MTNEVDHSGSNALISAFMEKNTEKMTYKDRVQQANEWNARESKKAGVRSQLDFAGIVYTIHYEPAERLVYIDPAADRTNPGQYVVVARDKEKVVEESFLWDCPYESEMDAVVDIIQDIQKRALKILLPERFFE